MLLLLMGWGVGSGEVVTFDFVRPRVVFDADRTVEIEAAKKIRFENDKTVR